MALSLICACGARFDVDETLAGQEVVCPECQQPLKAPALPAPPLRTSDWALASVVLALAGAFTVVGSLAAVGCGVVALASILRRRDRLAGLGLAVAGVLGGVVFTALTLFALSRGELFGLGGRLRENLLAEQLDTSGPLQVAGKDRTFEVVRPSQQWGVAREAPKKPADEEVETRSRRRFGGQPEKEKPEPRLRLGDAAAEALASSLKSDLLLVQPVLGAFVDVTADRPGNGDQDRFRSVADYRKHVEHVLNDLSYGDPPVRITGTRPTTPLPAGGGVLEAGEFAVELSFRTQDWRMLVRLYRTREAVFVVRGYARERNFARAEPELRKAMDSFRVR